MSFLEWLLVFASGYVMGLVTCMAWSCAQQVKKVGKELKELDEQITRSEVAVNEAIERMGRLKEKQADDR